MSRAASSPPNEAAERKALRQSVRRMYDWFNRGMWEKCYSLIDPRLRSESRVDPSSYSEGLRAFKDAYGEIRARRVWISPHLDASANKRDPRPFAYVYVVWQDAGHGFHMFKERWVKEGGRWYTRVAGLVPNRQESSPP